MKYIKSIISLATGLISAIIGLLLLWASFRTTEWGLLPALTGTGLVLFAIPFIPMTRVSIARLGRLLPALMVAIGLLMVGATSAAFIALGIGENRRIAAHPHPAPGVVALMRPAAILGVGEAAQHLGLAYFLGQDGPKDLVAARYWTTKAAQSGIAGAQLDLARMYARGLGGPADGDLALDWAKKAADQGLADACTLIGIFYLPGGPLPDDTQKANAAFAEGSERGDRESMFNLGLSYEYGTGVPKSPTRAFELYRAAAERGLPEAMLNVGVAYMNGAGVPADDDQARVWLEKSKAGTSAETRTLTDENLAIIESRQR